MTLKSLDQHIETTEGVCGGKARIAGRRITVDQIAFWHEQLGISADEIAHGYDLTLADVHAALAYYFDHRDEIERARKSAAALCDSIRSSTPSKLSEKLRERFGR